MKRRAVRFFAAFLLHTRRPPRTRSRLVLAKSAMNYFRFVAFMAAEVSVDVCVSNGGGSSKAHGKATTLLLAY